jgi:hypothetical protein
VCRWATRTRRGVSALRVYVRAHLLGQRDSFVSQLRLLLGELLQGQPRLRLEQHALYNHTSRHPARMRERAVRQTVCASVCAYRPLWGGNALSSTRAAGTGTLTYEPRATVTCPQPASSRLSQRGVRQRTSV